MIDSHVHFWDRDRLDYAWLDGAGDALERNFLPADLGRPGDLQGLVAVQADCRDDQALAEVAWLQELADAGAPIVAVVAHAPLEAGPLVAPHLARLASLPLVTGVRRLLQDEAAGFALQPDFVRGVRELSQHRLSMDLCIREHQLTEVTRLVEQCHDVLFVLDHLGKPTIASDAFGDWASDLSKLAALPNVRCKLSGVASEAPEAMRTPAALRPWLRHAVDVFGPGRCMFGSDWPLVESAGTYEGWVETVELAIDDLSTGERDRVMGLTARKTYLR